MADDGKDLPTASDVVYTRKGENSHPEVRSELPQNADQTSAAVQSTLPLPPELKLVDVKGITAEIEWIQNDQTQYKYHYEVSWWSDETDKKTDHTNSRNYIITKMKEGTTYSANVTQIYEDGSKASRASNTVHFDTDPAPPVEIRVENFRSSPHASIVVSFKDINKGRDVTHEVSVEAVTAVAEPIVIPTRNRQALVEGLIPGVTYSIAVQTKEGDKESDKAYYDTPVMTYPAIPEGVKLVHEYGKLKFTWKRPKITPLHYKVQREANGVIEMSTAKEEMFVLDDVKLSTMYRFKVAAVNNVGRGDFSEEKIHQTDPAPPQNISVQRNVRSPCSSFIVNYEDPDPLTKSYEVFATSLDGEVISHVQSNNNSAVLNGLPPGRSHYIYVVAIYGDLKSRRAYCTRNMIA